MNRFISYIYAMAIATAGFAEMQQAHPTSEKKKIAKRTDFSSLKIKACPLICPEEKDEATSSDCINPTVTRVEFRQGRPLEDTYLAGYNAPASIKLGECGTGAFYFKGSYLYWYANESNLNIASSFIATSGVAGVPQGKTSILTQPFHYRSAFKAGLGYEADNWGFDANYFWIRQHTSVSADAPAANPSVGTGVWQIEGWYIQVPATVGVIASTVSSKWQLHMDIGDLVLNRTFYLGPRLIAAPYGGLRGGIIRQSLRIASQEVLVSAAPPYPVVSHNRSHAWTVGPKMGSNFSYLLGRSFRAEGSVAASILYQRYQKLSHREDTTQTTDLVANPRLQMSNFSTLAPVLEMGLGLGCGWYCGRSVHIDFSLSYDFGVWWRQNYMRQLVDSYLTGSGDPGDLFLHGGTGTLKFAF